jgi:TonB family protein
MRIQKLLAFVSASLLIGAAVVAVSASRFAPQTAEQPVVVAAVAPPFPAIAAVARASGEVIVEVKINNAGEVSTTKAKSGHPLLRQAAEFAARRWKFAPSVGSTDPRTVSLTFFFTIFEEKMGEEKKGEAASSATVFFPPYKVGVMHVPTKGGSSGN